MQTSKMIRRTRRSMQHRSDYIHVNVGDVIGAYFDICGGGGLVGRVIDVKKRYALINHGTTRQNPLVTVVIANGDIEHFDNSFVAVVFKRAEKRQNPRNIFRDSFGGPEMWNEVRILGRKSVIRGTLMELAVLFLAQMNISLEREIDTKKLKVLFDKQKPGVVYYNGGFYWVNKKAFGRWVKKNATKICKNTKQLQAASTRGEQYYWDFVEEEDSEFFEELEGTPQDPDFY
jgi:hypothetical protein